MRIERVELDGFGRFSNEQWSLDEGMTILLGANEAGKTTLLNAIRALLFGFESTRDGRTWYPALSGGRRGGRLLLRTANGERWTVDRHGDRGGAGALVVEAPNGNRGGQDELNRLLGGADRDLFNNIFAFGLGELEAFSSLSGEGVRSRIYGAGSGLGGTSVVDIERRLRAEQEATYKPRGHEQSLTRLLARMEELRTRIMELEQQPEAYEAARSELARIAAQHAELRTRRREAAERREHLRRVLEAQPAAARLVTLQRDLGDPDPRVDALPSTTAQELDRLLAARDESRAALSTLDESLNRAERRRAEISVDDAFLGEIAEIQALRDERLAHDGRAAERESALGAVARLDGELRDLLRRIGAASEEAVLAIDDSIAAVEAVRSYDARLAEAASVADRLAERLESARREVTVAESELPGDTRDEDAIATQRNALAELGELRVEMAMLDGRERAGGRAPAGLPPRALALGAGLLILVVATLIGGYLGLLPWGIAAGLLLGAGTAALAVHQPRSSTVGSGRGRAELADRRRALLATAGLPADADEATIAAAREELATLQASARSSAAQRARLAERRALLEGLDAEAGAARDRRNQARGEWDAWLAEHGLAAGLSPDAARQVLEAAGVARRLRRERDEQQRRMDTIAEAAARYDDRLDALLLRLGRPVPSDAGLRPSTVVALGAEAQQAATRVQQAGDLDVTIAEHRARRAPLAAAVEDAERALIGRLAECGVTDVDELRRLAAAAARRATVRDQIAQVTTTLIALAGSETALPRLLASASESDPATLEAQRQDVADEVDRLEAEEAAALTREGELRGEIARLETTEELGVARQELAVLQGRAAEESRQWAVRAIALALLAETRRRYERERQPQVIHDAERYFASITDGRYPRIVAAPGESNVRVEPESGAARTTDELSRGTAEQLYLALRFGLIEQFARTAEPLPVVMDDILVNFDRQRALRAARAIRELATRHQVVFFTCHPQTAELLDPDGVATLNLG